MGKGAALEDITPVTPLWGSTAGAGRKGQAAASGGAYAPLTASSRLCRVIGGDGGYTTRASGKGRKKTSGQNVSRLLLHIRLFLVGLSQLGRLFLFPVIQQGHDLLLHLGGSNLLAKILLQFSH